MPENIELSPDSFPLDGSIFWHLLTKHQMAVLGTETPEEISNIYLYVRDAVFEAKLSTSGAHIMPQYP